MGDLFQLRSLTHTAYAARGGTHQFTHLYEEGRPGSCIRCCPSTHETHRALSPQNLQCHRCQRHLLPYAASVTSGLGASGLCSSLLSARSGKAHCVVRSNVAPAQTRRPRMSPPSHSSRGSSARLRGCLRPRQLHAQAQSRNITVHRRAGCVGGTGRAVVFGAAHNMLLRPGRK